MDVHDYLSKCDHEQAWHDSPLDTLAVHAADLAHRIDVSGEPMHAEIAALVSLIEQQAKRPPTFVRFETVYWIGERRFVVCTGTQTDCLAGLLAAQKRTRASVRWAIVSASGQAVYASEKSGRKVFGLSLDGLFRKVGEMKKGEE